MDLVEAFQEGHPGHQAVVRAEARQDPVAARQDPEAVPRGQVVLRDRVGLEAQDGMEARTITAAQEDPVASAAQAALVGRVARAVQEVQEAQEAQEAREALVAPEAQADHQDPGVKG